MMIVPKILVRRWFVTQAVLSCLVLVVIINIIIAARSFDLIPRVQSFVQSHWNADPLTLLGKPLDEIYHDVVSKLVQSPRNREMLMDVRHAELTFYDFENNVVGNTELLHNQFQRQPYVANGYIGSRIPNAGQGFAYDQLEPGKSEELLNAGWPLFNKRYLGAYIAGFFDLQPNATGYNFPELSDKGWDSFIAAIPQWTALQLSMNLDGKEHILSPATLYQFNREPEVTNYMQNMSLLTGVVTTAFTWLDVVDVTYTVFAHRLHQHLGVVHVDIKLRSTLPIEIVVEDIIDFATSERCAHPFPISDGEGIGMVFEPQGVPGVHGVVYSRLDHKALKPKPEGNKVVQYLNLKLDPESDHAVVTKYVGIALTDVVEDPWKVAKTTAIKTRLFTGTYNSHVTTWKKESDVANMATYKGNDLLTLTLISSLFHLAANTRIGADGVAAAVGVAGLSLDSYGGMVFWDSDLWMMHGMLPFLPRHLEQFANYRLHTHHQARKNVKESASDYHGNGIDIDRNFEGAIYPWTLGRYGNCTATGPCFDYEYHVNHAVAQTAWLIYLLGNQDEWYLREKVWPLVHDAAQFFSTLVTYNQTLEAYVTANLTDPDEFANHVDNGAYTNAAIHLVMGWCIDIGRHLNIDLPKNYTDIHRKMFLPNTNGVTLEFSGMNSQVAIKQADVVMLTYPLYVDELVDATQGRNNLEFYALKQVSYGPAMTFSIFSAVAAQLAQSGCAAQLYLMKLITPYMRAPFAQLSEQNHDDYTKNGGTHPAFPFLTGNGGYLQAVFQGITGYSPTYSIENGKLKRKLRVDPILIRGIGGHAHYQSVRYMNQLLEIEMNSTDFILTHHGGADGFDDTPIFVDVADRNPMAGSYTVEPDTQLHIPVFEPGSLFEGLKCECMSAEIITITEGKMGDHAWLINDGDVTLRWQLGTKSKPTKILVDLLLYQNVLLVEFNFGEKPPKYINIYNENGDYAYELALHLLLGVIFDDVDTINKYLWVNFKHDPKPQDEVFTDALVKGHTVKITAKWNPHAPVAPPSLFNTTLIELESPRMSRFLLIETVGTHDEDDLGPRFAEIIIR